MFAFTPILFPWGRRECCGMVWIRGRSPLIRLSLEWSRCRRGWPLLASLRAVSMRRTTDNKASAKAAWLFLTRLLVPSTLVLVLSDGRLRCSSGLAISTVLFSPGASVLFLFKSSQETMTNIYTETQPSICTGYLRVWLWRRERNLTRCRVQSGSRRRCWHGGQQV